MAANRDIQIEKVSDREVKVIITETHTREDIYSLSQLIKDRDDLMKALISEEKQFKERENFLKDSIAKYDVRINDAINLGLKKDEE